MLTKRDAITELIISEDVSVLHLQETWMDPESIRQWFRHSRMAVNYQIIVQPGNGPAPRGQGVATIIHKELAKNIHQLAYFDGRALSITQHAAL
jgi:exonuclease III